ncbi:MAG: N-acetyltransferase family protein [Flavitalea sp.]
MIVREATENDLPQMLEIYNEIIVNTTAVFHYEAHSAETRRDWFNLKKEQGFPVFVADENGTIAGFSSIGPFRPWPAYKYTVENSVYVAVPYRGKGVSKLLMQPLIDSARKLDMHAIIAVIEAENEASIKLHEKFGFVNVGQFPQVGYKFGKWLDLAFLQLTLDTPANPNENY